ncbi:MAG: DUF4446 family protein [Candidatus Cohnella colombiensis]|uniref:DUF4446 family protein n=1 Tax=Candidatus Cohnella colombiensis TaxID=3121368 RepID=A0AA95EWK7_9BACL|nr:MAG: DUF4446 family protein [Cohnella sp.]
MNEWNDQIAIIVAASEGLLLLILLIGMIVLSKKLKKLKTAHHKLMGETGVGNIEDAMNKLHEHLASVGLKQEQQEQLLAQHDRRLTTLKGNVGVHRFNAFSETGTDLSFSIAYVNDEQDGVVITGIHGREQTFLYAKPIEKGDSTYSLSPEEMKAISLALQKG